MTRYRIDFHTPTDRDPDALTVILLATGTTRASAMQRARRQSAKVDGCYVIATDDDGQDTGARCYVRGAFSHQDGAF